jgi:signal transduction histidine kinase
MGKAKKREREKQGNNRAKISEKIRLKDLFRISYEKQVIYFILLLLVFFGFTEIVSLSFVRKMEYKWLLEKRAEFSVLQKEVEKVLSRPHEEVKERLHSYSSTFPLKRIVVLNSDGSIIYDTSPYSERVRLLKVDKADMRTIRKEGTIVTSYWFPYVGEMGDSLYTVFFSPAEEGPFLVWFLKITCYIKLAGTIFAFILSGYFILFILSPFRRMGRIARNIKREDIKSVEGVISTFNETINELRRLYALERKKVKRMEREMSLKEHLASLGEMSAGIAHEFRNSLGSITGFTKLALKERGDDTYLKKVKDEAEALTRVVNQFLFFAKPQELERERFVLSDIFSDLTKSHPEGVEIQVSELDSTEIFADKNLLKRAFANILKNAFESMPDGGKVSIHTDFYPRKKVVKIIVKDEGVGIPSKAKGEIFTPFFSTKADGAGLGLSIVYKIITLHNGVVNVKSSRGGTRVEVELPVEEREE